MQLTNHFLLKFTTFNLYLKAMPVTLPTCRGSTLWRDLITIFKRSLKRSERVNHMQKQRGNGGALMEQREPHPTIRTSDGPAIPQLNSQTKPQWNLLKIPSKYHSKTSSKRHQPTNQNSRQ